MPNTPGSNLPYPALSSVPNVPSDLQSLTTALDTKVPGNYASASARSAAIPTPVDGQPAYRTDLHAQEFYNAGISSWIHTETLISETFLPSNQSSWTISSIAQEFRDLRLLVVARDTAASTACTQWALRFNGDSGTNYVQCSQVQLGLSGTITGGGGGPFTSTSVGVIAAGSSLTGSVWAQSLVEIPSYSNTSIQKNCFFRNSCWTVGSVNSVMSSGFLTWVGPGAITSITIVPNGGTQLTTGSIIRLYGIG